MRGSRPLRLKLVASVKQSMLTVLVLLQRSSTCMMMLYKDSYLA